LKQLHTLSLSGKSVQKVLLLSVSLLLALPGLSAFAADAAGAQEQIVVRADNLQHEQIEDVITATGKVELEWGASRLYADMARYYRDKAVIEADGKVRVFKNGDMLTGDSVRLNLESKTGSISNGTIFIKTNNLHFAGNKIEKSGEQEYRIDRGSVTTCDGAEPSWRFRADDLKLTVDEFASGKNAVFYLGELPVFWFPYLIFPAATERQSGFLIPKIGNSNKKGAFMELPYYWAISPSQDLTATLDFESARGLGLGLEHRYLSSNKGRGLSNAFWIYDSKQSRFRGDLELKQQFNFSEQTYWRADVNMTLDRDFYRDYGTDSGDYNRQYLATAAFLGHRFSSSLLATAGVDYLDDLDAPDNKSTLQKLPYVTLAGSGERLAASPFYYTFASSLTHFERQEGSRGERLILAPELTMQGTVTDAVSGRVSLGYYQLGYEAEEAGAANGSTANGVVRASAALQTGFSRIYDGSFGEFSRFRHLLVPELNYSITEKKSLQDIPFFDFDDRPVGGQLLTLSLNNFVTGRSVRADKVAYRDLLRFNVTQGYQLSGGRRDLLVLVDYGRPFTDTAVVAELLPLADLRLYSDNRISPYNGNVTNASLGVEVGKPAGTRASLDYHHAEAKLDYIEGKAAYADFRPYLFSLSTRYSFDRPGFLETLYAVEYKHQCWSLLLSYRDRIDNNEVAVTLSLSGLGMFKLL